MTSMQAHAPGPMTNRRTAMSVLEMNAAKFPAPVKALYDRLAAKRRAKGEGFGGPYLALSERVDAL